ncbi:MAG: capsular polysaccharide biosynthesis protein [Clostridia bacterium]|nr:capsular polysaccharide biosynthesis protein [Clostridia bacterium]
MPDHQEASERRNLGALPGAQNGPDEMEIDLAELFLRLLDRWYVIVAAALVGMLLFGLATFFVITPQYQATSKLYILNTSGSAINLSDLQIGSQLANDYVQVFNNWTVHERVNETLGLNYSYRKLQSMISVTNPTGTRLLVITVTSPDPAEAQALANTYAAVSREFIAKTMKTEQPTLFEEARLPSSPSSPNKTRNLLLGFFLGALLAVGVIAMMYILDDKVRTADDIKRVLGLPTLGVVTMQSALHGDGKRASKGAMK